MSDFPNTPDFPMVALPDHHWCHQFTIPLLFDDCLSLLQKLCTMWAKLNEVITGFNEWNTEFQVWAESVETNITDLYSKYTALVKRVTNIESDITDIKVRLANIESDLTIIKNRLAKIENDIKDINDNITIINQKITNLTNSITVINNEVIKLESDLTELTARVKKLEDLLANLNIIPPIKVLDLNGSDHDAQWRAIWNNWWTWFKPHLDFSLDGTIPATQFEYCANWYWWDTTTAPAREISVGQLGQPVVLCKLPFVAVAKSVWTSRPTTEDIIAKAPRMDFLAINPGDAFFNVPLTTAFPYTMDEFKFQTSVLPFLPPTSIVCKVNATRNQGTVYKAPMASLSEECSVRMRILNNNLTGKLAIVPSLLFVGAVPNQATTDINVPYDLYIWCVAENG